MRAARRVQGRSLYSGILASVSWNAWWDWQDRCGLFGMVRYAWFDSLGLVQLVSLVSFGLVLFGWLAWSGGVCLVLFRLIRFGVV